MNISNNINTLRRSGHLEIKTYILNNEVEMNIFNNFNTLRHSAAYMRW